MRENPSRIEFREVPWETGAVGTQLGIVPFIDGVSLVALAAESGSARHAGIVDSEVTWPSRHYLGIDALGLERVAVLGCQCSVTECNPLYVDVALDASTVTWSTWSSGTADDIDVPLEPMFFDRAQFEQALSATVDFRADLRP
ncbi:MAG: hypothetical protein Q8K56_00720 [Rhodoglobus sp.]|nr:hypothetical protein [Rhodoglobus sp.]